MRSHDRHDASLLCEGEHRMSLSESVKRPETRTGTYDVPDTVFIRQYR
jgi:hypothetical protein